MSSHLHKINLVNEILALEKKTTFLHFLPEIKHKIMKKTNLVYNHVRLRVASKKKSLITNCPYSQF